MAHLVLVNVSPDAVPAVRQVQPATYLRLNESNRPVHGSMPRSVDPVHGTMALPARPVFKIIRYVMARSVKQLLEQKDQEGLRKALADEPRLANQGMTIPYDLFCRVQAHPLHRLCDAVYSGKMMEEEALVLAGILLEHGADINGFGHGPPLLAAASLHTDQLGMLYIDHGADVRLTDAQDQASALHWAAYCGRDLLVDRLIQAQAPLDLPDRSHGSTPLGWALHALASMNKANLHHQPACLHLLVRAGADIHALNRLAREQLFALADEHKELKDALLRAGMP